MAFHCGNYAVNAPISPFDLAEDCILAAWMEARGPPGCLTPWLWLTFFPQSFISHFMIKGGNQNE